MRTGPCRPRQPPRNHSSCRPTLEAKGNQFFARSRLRIEPVNELPQKAALSRREALGHDDTFTARPHTYNVSRTMKTSYWFFVILCLPLFAQVKIDKGDGRISV